VKIERSRRFPAYHKNPHWVSFEKSLNPRGVGRMLNKNVVPSLQRVTTYLANQVTEDQQISNAGFPMSNSHVRSARAITGAVADFC